MEFFFNNLFVIIILKNQEHFPELEILVYILHTDFCFFFKDIEQLNFEYLLIAYSYYISIGLIFKFEFLKLFLFNLFFIGTVYCIYSLLCSSTSVFISENHFSCIQSKFKLFLEFCPFIFEFLKF